MSNAQLTPEQEEKLISEYIKVWDDGDGLNEHDLKRFGKLYYAALEREKSQVSGERKSAEGTLKELVPRHDFEDGWIDKPDVITAMTLYAAQEVAAAKQEFLKVEREKVKGVEKGLAERLKEGNSTLRKRYGVDHPFRQGYCFAEEVVKKWQEEYAAQFQPKWLPIDSAPKDWRDVLLYVPEHSYTDQFGEKDNAEEEVIIGYFSDAIEGNNQWRYTLSGVSLMFEPTHWQPLPTPPTPQP